MEQPDLESVTVGTVWNGPDETIRKRSRSRANASGDASGDEHRSNPTDPGISGTESENGSGTSEANPFRVTNPPRSPRGKGKQPDAMAQASAGMLIGVIEATGRSRYGDAGAMLAPEKDLMTRGVAACIDKLPKRQQEKLATWSGPLMLAMGFVMYANRMAFLEMQRQAVMRQKKEEVAAMAHSPMPINPDAADGLIFDEQAPNGKAHLFNTMGDL